MSKSETAAVYRREDEDDDCPLCFEPLPPFWDVTRRARTFCCGKDICSNCQDKINDVVTKALANGTFGKEEEQLGSCCPFCRTRLGFNSEATTMSLDKFEKGDLPLSLYYRLGVRILNGLYGVEKNEEKGIEILLLGAERGDPCCQYALGVVCLRGDSRLPPGDAKRWLSAATEQGHAIAEYHLAFEIKKEGNDAEFLRLVRGSASKGYDDACYNIGLAHYYGDHGLQQSTEDAIRVLTPAAERGHAESMTLLGSTMCGADPKRKLVPPTSNPTFVQGVHWMRRAAGKGDEKALELLAPLEEQASSKCFMCDKDAPPEKAFLRCSRCRAAWYCSKECQVKHWKAKGGHKQCCINWCDERRY